MSPTFSVICNTLDRADALRQLLVSLRHQTYESFEVIVVAGPCSDHTAEVVAEFAGGIKARTCPERNLSMSRNIGIAAAAGDLVAFIDDDAVPEHTWLAELAELYSSDEIAGAGGVVHDHTGYGFQTRFILCDRLGRAEYSDTTPFDAYSFPGSMKYPSVLGCNSSFRRTALVAVGGFDEEYEYYLDETDVCVRLVDAGYVIRQSPRAAVHHKFLPSSVRDHHKVVLDNYPIIKNAVYFSFVNGRDHLTTSEIYAGAADFCDARTADLAHNAAMGRITDEQYAEAAQVIQHALRPGIAIGERGRVQMYDRALESVHGGEFLPFPTIERHGRRLRVCLVTQTLPPAVAGGIGRYCLDLGRELGRRGHDVRIITDGAEHSTVDFEDGVWVHRIAKSSERAPTDDALVVPAPIWSNSAAVADEIVRIQGEGPIDLVYAPIWDVEGLAIAEATSTLTITALMTTMGISLQNRPAWSEDAEFMATLGAPIHELERRVLGAAHGLHAISSAIVQEIESASGVVLDDDGLFTSHLGVVDSGSTASSAGDGLRDADEAAVTVLFVGRFERRKGIDLLFEAIPDVLSQFPDARFELIGRDDLPNEAGVTYRDAFEAAHAGASWWDRVTFRGEATDDEVVDAYRRADVFVAPSRFESFGLIFVEAMMAGTPVVALARGAAPEVIGDTGAGVLAEPDARSLTAALSGLVGDADLRAVMGAAARRRFEDAFTVSAMTDAVERDLRSCRSFRPGSAEVSGGTTLVELPDHTEGLELGDTPVTVGPLPEGRATAVVHVAEHGAGQRSERPEVVVAVGMWTATVAGDRPGFHHVTLPSGSDRIVTLTAAGRGAALAAVHVVPGRGRRA